MNNLPLKIVLWLPYVISLFILFIVMGYLTIRFDLTLRESCYLTFGVIMYAELRTLAEKVRYRYWRLTKCKDL